jgi:hypothetical protein
MKSGFPNGLSNPSTQKMPEILTDGRMGPQPRRSLWGWSMREPPRESVSDGSLEQGHTGPKLQQRVGYEGVFAKGMNKLLKDHRARVDARVNPMNGDATVWPVIIYESPVGAMNPAVQRCDPRVNVQKRSGHGLEKLGRQDASAVDHDNRRCELLESADCFWRVRGWNDDEPHRIDGLVDKSEFTRYG